MSESALARTVVQLSRVVGVQLEEDVLDTLEIVLVEFAEPQQHRQSTVAKIARGKTRDERPRQLIWQVRKRKGAEQRGSELTSRSCS
jgi:hypothetical protein